jgi:hypothetical protein
MSDREDSKITWITCPDCGAKVGVVISVGKPVVDTQPNTISPHLPAGPQVTQGSLLDKLTVAGIDLSLVDVEEGSEIVSISPKKFLGDLWGPINEAVRTLGGIWIRDGRASRWEINKEDMI